MFQSALEKTLKLSERGRRCAHGRCSAVDCLAAATERHGRLPKFRAGLKLAGQRLAARFHNRIPGHTTSELSLKRVRRKLRQFVIVMAYSGPARREPVGRTLKSPHSSA